MSVVRAVRPVLLVAALLAAALPAPAQERGSPAAAEIQTLRKRIAEVDKTLQQQLARLRLAAMRATNTQQEGGGVDSVTAAAGVKSRGEESISYQRTADAKADVISLQARARVLRGELDSLHTRLTYLNATAALDRGDTAAAVEVYRTAIRREGPGHAADYNLGLILAARDSLDAAAAIFARVADSTPDDPRPVRNLAWVGAQMLQRERYESAAAAFAVVTRRDSTFFDAWYNYGLALSRLDRWAELVPVAEQAARLQPGHRDALVMLQYAYAKTGQADKAAEVLGRIPPG